MRAPRIPLAYDLKRLRALSIKLICIALGAVLIGCSSKPEPFPTRRNVTALAYADDGVAPTTQRSDLQTFKMFSVYATPPDGWKQKINNAGDPRAEHVTWISPTGRTAFGVLFFKLPFPVGHDLAFRWGFLPEAEKREGPATVIDKYWDDDLQGMRFTVDTKKYRVEAKFFVRGTRGWASYAGTRNDMPFEAKEREQAVLARENAEFGEEFPPPPATQPAE